MALARPINLTPALGVSSVLPQEGSTPAPALAPSVEDESGTPHFPLSQAGAAQAAGTHLKGLAPSLPPKSSPTAPIYIRQPHTGKLSSHQYRSPGGTLITATLNIDYNPLTSTRKIVPVDAILFKYLQRQDSGGISNYEGGAPNYPQHLETMDKGAVYRGIQEYIDNADNAKPLKALGITTIDSLSPKQAVMLSDLIARENLDYHGSAWAKSSHGGFSDEALLLQKELDIKPLESLFEKGALGLCRTFAEMSQGVFEVLKEHQIPGENHLINSYYKVQDGYMHNWGAVYTVQPNGEAMVTQIDPTWNRRSSEPFPTDYTFGGDNVREYYRMNTLLHGTNWRELAELGSWIDPRFQEWGIDGMQGSLELGLINQRGGLRALHDKIKDWSAPLLVKLTDLLDDEALAAYQKWRVEQDQAPLATSNPNRNR